MDNLKKFIEILNEQLLAHSFEVVKDSNGNKIPGIYIRMENPVLYILGVYEKQNQQETTSVLAAFTKQMSDELEEMRCNHLVSLSIRLDEEGGEVYSPSYLDERIHTVNWRYSLAEKKVYASEGQPNRLLGIEKLLFLSSQGHEVEKPIEPSMKGGKPWVSIGIFAICTLLLIYTTLSGRGASTIRAFGLSRSGILDGEYYRFLTSMFLHSGIAHLVSNGIFLYYFGVKAEYLLGRGRFLALYLIAGLCGGLLSVAFHNVLAIGASGAIYGLLGAMLILTKKYGPRYTQMNYSTMLLLAFTSIGFGFLDMGVDNFAHIGGFLGGILVFLFYMKCERKNR
ncbi:rhomboid family intramembrane serine protease [Anaerotignum sp.]|uniref:rhomboid family intramembrane serine protease n=1 Tax=Anaerotignum sp. TaxID=2039241 RepID=UPI0028AA94ED|nr:rhomboid family intramembrane serine protease [Anaerotignum sp.]